MKGRPKYASSAGSAPINSTLWDKLLPSRIFSTDRYPDARLNVYSRPDILCFIVHVLKGTPELKKIMNSCFGPLFTIPVHRCPISGKLIHALLCRQLVTKQEYEMWTVFGGQPMRFSLVEFGAVTGLPCGEFPQGYDPDLDPAPLSHEEHYWDKLIGDNREFTLADVASILEDKEIEDGDRKLRLALLLIVDGVLVASRQRNRPTFKYVAMLEDVDSFLSFPWGRESFLKTISTMRPAKKKTTAKPVLKRLKRNAKCKDPLASFTHQLQQQSIRLNGFPLALQLLAFRNVSGLVDKIPGTLDSPTLIEWDSLLLPKSYLTLSDVHNVECSSNVSVDPWIHCDDREEGWGEWDDEVKDKKVAYMVAQILNGHIFTKNEWPGGFSSLPLIKASEKKPDVSHRKHIVSRRKNTTRPASMRVKQPTSTSKQRRRRSKRHCVINNKDHDYPVDLEDLIQSEMVSVRNEFSLTVQKLQSRFTKLENKFKALRFQKSRKFRRLSSHRSSKKNRSSLKEDPPHPSGSLSPLIHMTDTRVEDEVHIQLSPRTVVAQGVKHKMKKYCGTEDCGSDSPCEDSTAAVRGGNPIYNTARQNEQTPPPNLPKTSSSSEPMPIYNTASSFPHMLKDSNAPDEAQTQSAIAVSSEFPSPQLAITNAPLTVCKGSKSNLTQGETSEGHKQVSPEGEPITSGGQTQDFAEGAPGTDSPPFSSVLASSIITTAKNRTSRAASLGGVQPPNISYSGSRVNVSADTSLPNNPMGQSPRLHFPSCIDICDCELEKLSREQGTLRKNFEETTSELKAELERKMGEVFNEYDRKFQEIDAAYNAQAKKVESVRSLVAMNSLLANAYRSTCPVKSAATGTAAVRARSSQHSTQQQQAVQSNTHMSSTQSSVTAVEALIPNLSGPFSHIPRCNTPQPIPISQPPLVQSNTHINSTTLPRPSVTAEAISLHSPSSNMPQPPLISNHTPSSYSTPSAPHAHGIIRPAMAPHLRSSRPPNSDAPSTTYPRLVQQQQEQQ